MSNTIRAAYVGPLGSLLAAFIGQEAEHIAAVEVALTEAADGHVDCARKALEAVPDANLRRAIAGAALLSKLAADVLVDRATPPAAAAEGVNR